MVAIIKTGYSIRGTFYYNENKYNEGKATFLLAQNYPMDQDRMTDKHRLNMLLKTAATNENVKRNSVHISLNFAPGEIISEDKLREIAKEYMERIGFGDQPYLVYEHHDAGHPHIHLVSVKVRPDGSRIDTNDIGRNQSTKAREALEEKHGLVRAKDHEREFFQLKSVQAEKALYGRTETKRAISNVLDYVMNHYKFASLAEFNSVLNLYNVHADRGTENSRIYKNNGLTYRIMDEKGQLVGVPIKASAFHYKPTLKSLEKKFLINHSLRQNDKARIKTVIDLALKRNTAHTFDSLAEQLKKEGISLVQRVNKDGVLYGLTYVDHKTKAVFNGSDLGKDYSAKMMQERCRYIPKPAIKKQRKVNLKPISGPDMQLSGPGKKGTSLLETLFKPEHAGGADTKEDWRKRRKKRQNNNVNNS